MKDRNLALFRIFRLLALLLITNSVSVTYGSENGEKPFLHYTGSLQLEKVRSRAGD